MKVLAHCFASLYRGWLGLLPGESRRLVFSFGLVVMGGRGTAAFFCSFWVELLLSKRFLSCLGYTVLFWFSFTFLFFLLEGASFYWGFCSLSWVQLEIAGFGDIHGKKENPGTHCCVVPWVLSSLVALPSHHLSESYVCSIFNVHGFSCTLWKEPGEYIYSILKAWSSFVRVSWISCVVPFLST